LENIIFAADVDDDDVKIRSKKKFDTRKRECLADLTINILNVLANFTLENQPNLNSRAKTEGKVGREGEKENVTIIKGEKERRRQRERE